jgi:hypothetical protein
MDIDNLCIFLNKIMQLFELLDLCIFFLIYINDSLWLYNSELKYFYLNNY